MLAKLAIFTLLMIVHSTANASWLCEEAASIKEGDSLTVCGIGSDKDEDVARKKALDNAFTELDKICNRSADCKDFLLNIEPLRNDCKKLESDYKCFRAVRADITEQKKPKDDKQNQKQAVEEKEKKEVEKVSKWSCAYPTDETLKLFADLTTPKRIRTAIRSAKKIPFKLACSKFHYRVMNILKRASIVDKSYNSFLNSILQSQASLSYNGVTESIIEYFHEQGVYSDKLWKIILDTYVRYENGYHYRITPDLFHTDDTNAKNKKLQLARLDQVVSLALAEKIGRPTPMDSETAFTTVMRGTLSSPHEKNPWLAVHLLENHLKKAPVTLAKDYLYYLGKLYQNSSDGKVREKSIRWINSVLSKTEPNAKTEKELVSFIEKINQKISRLDDEEDDELAQIKQLKADKLLFGKINGKYIDLAFSKNENKWAAERNILFCLDNHIDCPKTVPSKEKLKKMLKSKKDKKREMALKVLSRQPNVSRSIENEIYDCLLEATEKRGRSNIAKQAIQALINHKVTDSKKIDMILKLSLDRVFNYEEVIDALGPLSTPSVVKIANDDKHPSQFSGLRMLGRLSKTDNKAKVALQKIAKESTNASLKREAEKLINR